MVQMNRPYSVQIEFVQGCNRRCSFCGITSYKDTKTYFMSRETINNIAEQCSRWLPDRRYELAMHGEPTLHPEKFEFIGTLRDALPKAQIQMTSNGYKVTPANIEFFFDVGLDFIILDMYESDRTRIMEMLPAFKSKGIKVIDFYNSDISPYHNHKRKIRDTVFLMDALNARSGIKKSRVLLNCGGNSADQPWPASPLKKVCTNMFRELSICYNGDVNICCMDYAHEFTCGNVLNESLEDIWHGENFMAARRYVRNKMRHFSPCARCNYGGGMRQGLLPKIELPLPEDENTITSVLNSSMHNNDLPILNFIGKKDTAMYIKKGMNLNDYFRKKHE